MITVFENEEFGTVRTVIEDGRILFCAKDVAKSLGYVNLIGILDQSCLVRLRVSDFAVSRARFGPVSG